MTHPITEDMLPCVISCNDNEYYYVVNKLTDNGCYYDNSWVCEWKDNPQLIITIAELHHYFPERCI